MSIFSYSNATPYLKIDIIFISNTDYKVITRNGLSGYRLTG